MLVLAKLFAMIYILGFPGSVTAGRRNITIDDQFGDERTHVVPTFMPTDDWIIGGTGGSVMPCRSLAYKGTWHDTTHRVGTPATSVSFGFTGECLYVYCIIANLERGSELYAFADYKFVVDGELVGRYTRVPEETNVPLYFINTLVYANTSMENRFHNFSIVLDSTVQPVLLLFDYAVYTIVEEDGANTTAPSSSTTPDVADTRSKSSSAVVVGSTLGAVAILFCAGLLTLVVRRHGQRLWLYRWRWPSALNFRNNIPPAITHNPLLVLDPTSPPLTHAPGPKDVATGYHENMIMDLRQRIQDLRVEKRSMRAALGITYSE
ncbi:hypothetical protein AB1N83_009233 [Pleurotus pulmonarius]